MNRQVRTEWESCRHWSEGWTQWNTKVETCEMNISLKGRHVVSLIRIGIAKQLTTGKGPVGGFSSKNLTESVDSGVDQLNLKVELFQGLKFVETGFTCKFWCSWSGSWEEN